MSTEILEEIRTELRELRMLYKGLVDKILPIEEPTPEEKKAIEEEDEPLDEKELMKSLDR
jgi:hypothetical protein